MGVTNLTKDKDNTDNKSFHRTKPAFWSVDSDVVCRKEQTCQ